MTLSDPLDEALRRHVADVVAAHTRTLTERVESLETYASAVETAVQESERLGGRVERLESFLADPFGTTCEALRSAAEGEGLDYWEPVIGRVPVPDPDWAFAGPPLHPSAQLAGSTAMRWARDGRELRLAIDGMGRLSLAIGHHDTPEALRRACPAFVAPFGATWRWLATGGPMPGDVVEGSVEPATEPEPQ